jgi:hypothetical protein
MVAIKNVKSAHWSASRSVVSDVSSLSSDLEWPKEVNLEAQPDMIVDSWLKKDLRFV